jgi:hypothetical protein
MAFNNKSGVNEINNDGTFVVAGNNRFPSAASLPTGNGLAGYLAYVQDTETLQLNIGSGLWRKFQTRAIDYKNEVILEQGTVGGGYNASSIFQSITKIHYASDAPIQLLPTLSFTTKYGNVHSTAMHAYYHQGDGALSSNNGYGACKQDWATMTVTTITSRSSCGGSYITSTQPGPKQQNTFGVVMLGLNSCYITFATDSWTNGGYSTGLVDNSGGLATFGESYAYTIGTGSSNVYKLDWVAATPTWTATSSGTGTWNYSPKALNSKWNKWYQSGGTSSTNLDIYLNASNTYSTSPSTAPFGSQEQETLMGQDWGYWTGIYNDTADGPYSSTIFKTDYSSNTTKTVQRGSFNYKHASGDGCWGPMP